MKLVHISSLFFDNAGDKYLSYSVKKIFEDRFGKIKWFDFDIRRLCSVKDVDLFNSYDGVIIGGGGLILPSSFYKKQETGWTLGISSDLINTISSPIIVYGIGYNLFRGEEIFDKIFVDNINCLLKRSSFFSLRHSSDILKIKKHIVENYWNKIRLNFCSSLFGDEYYKTSSENIAFQLAWDRLGKRFGNYKNIVKFIYNITEICGKFSLKNRKIFLVSHTKSDLPINTKIFEKLKQKNVSCELINLVGENVSFLVNFYRGVGYVFAMRGHSQMIPMGLGCKIVSLISHDKIFALLEDLGITQMGVEVNDEDFLNKCMDAYCCSSSINFQFVLEKARQNINENMDIIEKILK